jgi:hypothetical protein
MMSGFNLINSRSLPRYLGYEFARLVPVRWPISSDVDPQNEMAPDFRAIFLAFRSVATALPARYRAAIVAPDRGGYHAAVSPWADRDTAWADADGDISIPPTTVPVVVVSPDLNIDLGHLQVLGLGWKCAAKQWGSHQYRRGCRYGESDLRHGGPPYQA